MRSLLISLLLLAAVSLTCCLSTHQPELAEDKFKILEITLERTGSWGMKSGYKVVLHKDGVAEYAGDVHAKRKGKYLGKVSLEQFAQLAKIITENEFFSLDNKYHAPVTDTDTVYTSVVYSGGRKTVEDFGRGGGERLTAIERAIDQAVEQIAWTQES